MTHSTCFAGIPRIRASILRGLTRAARDRCAFLARVIMGPALFVRLSEDAAPEWLLNIPDITGLIDMVMQQLKNAPNPSS
jgi:hypothetical protein